MRIKKSFLLAFLCFALSSFLLSGCATTAQNNDSSSAQSASLKTQSILKFSDVPVPVGLKPLPLESYSFESSGVRVGVLKYTGKASPDLVINFYKEQMPMYNWSLVNVIEYGQRLMNFEREAESCIISIQPKGNNLTLTVSLGPKSQGAIRKNRQVIK